MDSRIINVLWIYAVLSPWCSYVTFLKHEHILVLVEEHPDPNVKFSSTDQEWPLNVLLYDEVIVLNLEGSFWGVGFLLAFLDLDWQLLQLLLVLHDLLSIETSSVRFIKLIHLIHQDV